MAAAGNHTNAEFELRGFNHLALVCRDMAETVEWYEDKLGMRLVKTLELPGGRGQHFFLDMGNGRDGVAFFWFPDAAEGEEGVVLQDRFGVTAIGSTNHIAFDVPPELFDEYRGKLRAKGV
jgi:catechol 2,3-dioxygenase-like lactoylglutathione lyase family enzyme